MARTEFRTEADYDAFERMQLAAAVAESDVTLGDAPDLDTAFLARSQELKSHLRRIATRRQVVIG